MQRGVLYPPATAGKHKQEAGSYHCWTVARAPGLQSIPCRLNNGILCNPHGVRTAYVVRSREAFSLNPLMLPHATLHK